MKKFISGVLMAFLLSAGFVAVSAETASAATCKPTKYVECQTTSTKATPSPKVITQGKPAKVKVTVSTRGNVKARGTVTVKVTGPGGYKKTIKVHYSGKAVSINLGKLNKPGKYKIAVTFDGGDGFKDSKSTSTITVKKKKKR
ncbi:Ig-like domain repeat protein [Nocardioides conyzicola]|uniref:Bacterial Ig-like domain-containing protein n=1 Tax=Nocardioides conyzicola TaxID=1651781 RepID=A0ABP8XHM9_9ACTN